MKGVFEKRNKFGFSAKHTVGFRGFPPMFHSHCEIIAVFRGEINMRIDGKELTVRAGEISAVFPYVLHSYEDAPDTEFCIILFDPEAVSVFEKELLRKRPMHPVVAGLEWLFPRFEKVAALYRSGDEIQVKTAVSYLSAIVGELLCSMSLGTPDEVTENMIKPILLYCSEHFADSDISIKRVADELYISQSYVSKVFSSKLKYGFREYVNELRISEARRLLAKTDRKIVDIMLDCGFKNQSSFNRIFSDMCGMSPKKYRSAASSDTSRETRQPFCERSE